VGRLGGPSGPSWRGPCPVCLSEARLAFAGFKWGFPSCLRGPLGLSPTVAPEHLRVRHQGSRRCWSLLIGRPSLLACERFPWGRVSRPAGLALEALQECGRTCRGLSRDLVRGRGTCFSRRRQCFSRLRRCTRYWPFPRWVQSRRCSRASSPRAWARSRRSGRALRLVF
jgi:hypothetical protein